MEGSVDTPTSKGVTLKGLCLFESLSMQVASGHPCPGLKFLSISSTCPPPRRTMPILSTAPPAAIRRGHPWTPLSPPAFAWTPADKMDLLGSPGTHSKATTQSTEQTGQGRCGACHLDVLPSPGSPHDGHPCLPTCLGVRGSQGARNQEERETQLLPVLTPPPGSASSLCSSVGISS